MVVVLERGLSYTTQTAAAEDASTTTESTTAAEEGMDEDESPIGEAQELVIPKPHPIEIPVFLCGALGSTAAISVGILVAGWLHSAWGGLAGVPFAAWQQSGCPVQPSLLPMLL